MVESELYTARLQALFDKWQRETGLSVKNKTFSPDGIVNPEIWFGEDNKKRILFVLKETNRWCNLCEYVVRKKENGLRTKWQTWYNITRWAYLLRHIHDQTFDEMWQRVKHIDEKKRIYNLERIALVNVKKAPGGKMTDYNELIEAFERHNQVYLLREIELFGHIDYIVCCGKGVSTCINSAYGGLDWEKQHGSRHRYARTGNGTLIVDYVHPQSREKKKELFKGIYDVVIQANSLP